MVSTSNKEKNRLTDFEPPDIWRGLKHERLISLGESGSGELTSPPELEVRSKVEAIENRLTEKFKRLLADRLKFRHILPLLNTFDEVSIAYKDDWEAISIFKNEWINIIQTLVRIESEVDGTLHLQERSNALEHSQDRWRQQILSGVSWPAELSSVMGAPVAALPLEQAQQVLADNLSDMTLLIAQVMPKHLTYLSEQQVCGEIEWFGKNECRYKYFVRHVESTNASVIRESWSAIENAEQTLIRRDIGGTIGRYLHWHVHDLVNAIVMGCQNSGLSIPPGPQAVLDAIPNWLRQETRIVQGKLISERLIVQDLETETWSAQVEEIRNMPFDPAIVLGSFVLTGWKGPT